MSESTTTVIEGKVCIHCEGVATQQHAGNVFSCDRRVCVLVATRFVEGAKARSAAMEPDAYEMYRIDVEPGFGSCGG